MGDAGTSNIVRAAWWFFGLRNSCDLTSVFSFFFVTLFLFHLSTHCHGHTLDLVSSPHPLILRNFYFFIYFTQLLPHLFFKLVKTAKILASPWSPFLLTFLLADMKRRLPTPSCIAEAAGALPMSSWIPFTV